MKTIAIHNLGCKVNSYELDVLTENLRKSGHIIVPFDEKADIYIVNTCTVTNPDRCFIRQKEKIPRL